MPQHIGIVACSAEGAALCYKTICVEGAGFLGPHAHPEVSLHTHSLADYVDRLDRGDRAGVAELMLSSARKLARAGADFVICPDNTIHQAMSHVLPHSPLPWLHIAEVVATEAAARGYRKLGITGTRWLVDSEVYPEKIEAEGLAWLRPHERTGLRRRRAGMHRDPADHERRQLAAADARLDATARTRSPEACRYRGFRKMISPSSLRPVSSQPFSR
jgi:aspartate/glutamate racemase